MPLESSAVTVVLCACDAGGCMGMEMGMGEICVLMCVVATNAAFATSGCRSNRLLEVGEVGSRP